MEGFEGLNEVNGSKIWRNTVLLNTSAGLEGSRLTEKKPTSHVWVNPICLFNPPFIMVPPFCGHFAHPESIIRPNAFPTSLMNPTNRRRKGAVPELILAHLWPCRPFQVGVMKIEKSEKDFGYEVFVVPIKLN